MTRLLTAPADFVRTAALAWRHCADSASFLRLFGDQFWIKVCRLFGLRPSNQPRTIRLAPGISVSYRMNRGDVWSLREVLLYQCYRIHKPLQRFVLVDLGANIGLTSVWMSRHYPVAALVAVEANDANAALVRENLQRNGVRGLVEEAAIGPSDGHAFFSDLDDSNYGHLASSGRQVRMVAMDTVLQRLAAEYPDTAGLPVVVKLDIEGGEQALLHENSDWLQRVHAIIAEFHPDAIDYPGCIRRVQSYGFSYHRPGSLGPDSMDFFIRP